MYTEIQQRIKDLGLEVDGFITYKQEICKLLEVEPKTGNAKIAHMNQIQQYMKLEQIGKGKGTKYKILQIYDVPVEKVDGRKGNTSHKEPTLGEDGEILFHLVWISKLEEDGGSVILKNQLFSQLGQCNQYFKALNDNKFTYASSNTQKVLDGEYYCHANTHYIVFDDIYNRFSSQVDKMKIPGLKRGTIIYHNTKEKKNFTRTIKRKVIPDDYFGEGYYIQVTEFVENTVEVDGLVWQIADEGQVELIDDCRQRCIDTWNTTHKKHLETFGDVFTKLNITQRREFLDMVDELIKYNIKDYAYSAGVFIYDTTLEREIEILQALGCNITLDNYKQFVKYWIPVLRHEVNKRSLKYRYSNIDKNLQKQQLEAQRPHYGKIKYEYANTCLVHEYEQAVTLIALAYQLDLTGQHLNLIYQLLNK